MPEYAPGQYNSSHEQTNKVKKRRNTSKEGPYQNLGQKDKTTTGQ